ncbi:hypothetical protein P175DRAFT_077158 [Aspergillus ochraceoroseus IBT 24754]|uniref:Uncharacterized protein n=1 Tax=Aspergillus ochraceoroseus IBT 24754 TaxID=1392256 RepID=A0A2T5MA08_9EURO|nr:uncharacterized protein P175DRAFT_077158 [Aspergillus ochraceoroseus IBT 24754]PTU25373.1 hypothetical protein P175DRAFT_077158 [Aspergillus ochraceoroseus IBT 24754]
MPTLLILESIRTDAALSPTRQGSFRNRPSFRNIFTAVGNLYEKDGIRLFFRGLKLAVIYQVTHYTLRAVLQEVALPGTFTMPLTYAIASMLLCELHLLWTECTISVRPPGLLPFAIRHETQRWKQLSVPAFVHGLLLGLMKQVATASGLSELSSEQYLGGGTAILVGKEVAMTLYALLLRLVGLLPASVVLTLIEVRILPKGQETVVPFSTKRGLRTGEFFTGIKSPLGFKSMRDSRRLFHMSQMIWLIELHLKKCMVLIMMNSLAQFLVSLAF